MSIDKFYLRVSPSWMVLQQANDAENKSYKSLFVDRKSGEMAIQDDFTVAPLISSGVKKTIYGIVGLIESPEQKYFVFVSEKENVGTIFHHNLYKVKKFEFVPIKNFNLSQDADDLDSLFHNDPRYDITKFMATQQREKLRIGHGGAATTATTGSEPAATRTATQSLTVEQEKYEKELIRMYKRALGLVSFYYSYTLDLTHNTQQQYYDFKLRGFQPPIENANKSFFWNHRLVENLRNKGMDSWLVPMIAGFVGTKRIIVGTKMFNYMIISRISCLRAGFDSTCCGVDVDGNVANFVETEQIIHRGNEVTSFVQIRSSVPLIWNQYPNGNFYGKINIKDSYTHNGRLVSAQQLFTLNMRDSYFKYGNNLLLSFLRNVGSEAELSAAFRVAVEKGINDLSWGPTVGEINAQGPQSQPIAYMNWDDYRPFYAWKDDIQNDFEKVADVIKEHRFFVVRDNIVDSEQTGVIRTNDINSLDRCSLFQSLLAYKIAMEQVRVLGLDTEITEQALEKPYHELWSANINAISQAYSGASGINARFVRYRGFSFYGLLWALYIRYRRFMHFNFESGIQQDALDILLGKAKLTHNYREKCKKSSIPHIMIYGSIISFLLSFPTLGASNTAVKLVFFFCFWILGFAIIIAFGVTFHEYIDRPQLNGTL